MAVQRKRTEETSIDPAAGAPLPETNANALPTFSAFPDSLEAEKTSFDLDAFAPYKREEPDVPIALGQSDDEEPDNTLPFLIAPQAPISIDEVTDLSGYAATSAPVDFTHADDTPSFGNVENEEAGRFFVQIGKFSATYILDNDDMLIGRPDPITNVIPDIAIEIDDAISRMHARVFRRKDETYIEDLGSTNGTKVNGIALSPHRPQLLSNCDLIHVGSKTEIVYYK